MIRKATIADLDSILDVIIDAKQLFKKNNSTQWQDLDGYPNRETFINDLKNNLLYVYVIADKVVGVCCLMIDEEETYKKIYNGSWINLDNYCVIHRLAVKSEYYGRGIAKSLLLHCEDIAIKNKVYNIKVDTMHNNKIMHNLLTKLGYEKCGIIYLARENVIDKERVAYQKVLSK